MFLKEAEKLESFVGADAQFRGELKVKGMLRVDGAIEGGVKADCVVLSETARVKGDIAAQKIIIGGRVEGNLRAKESVEIQSKGKILGEIFTGKLSVMEGAVFNGKIQMNSKESKVIDFEPKTQDLPEASNFVPEKKSSNLP